MVKENNRQELQAKDYKNEFLQLTSQVKVESRELTAEILIENDKQQIVELEG
jgi:hypothetical protein